MSTEGGSRDVDCLLCQVEGCLCALPLAHAAEITRALPIQPLDGAPEGVLGLSMIRGSAVPVVSAAALFGDETGAPAARFVVLRVEGRRVALAVDAVLGVRRFPTDLLSGVPPLLSRAASGLAAIGALDASLLLVLDATRLLPGGSDLADCGGRPAGGPLDASRSVLT